MVWFLSILFIKQSIKFDKKVFLAFFSFLSFYSLASFIDTILLAFWLAQTLSLLFVDTFF